MDRTKEQLSTLIEDHVRQMRDGHTCTDLPTPGAVIRETVMQGSPYYPFTLDELEEHHEKDPNPWIVSNPYNMSNASLLRGILERTIFVDPEFDPSDPVQKRCILELPWRGKVEKFEPLSDVRLLGPTVPLTYTLPDFDFRRGEVVQPMQTLRRLSEEPWFMELGLAPIYFMVTHYLGAAGFVKLR